VSRFNNKSDISRLFDGKLRGSPSTTTLEELWNASCIKSGEDGELAVMNEILSRVFVIGFLLVYAGLVMGFLSWNLGRWLRSSGKKRPWPAFLEYLSASRFFNRPSDAH
jgi:hypothetical protein